MVTSEPVVVSAHEKTGSQEASSSRLSRIPRAWLAVALGSLAVLAWSYWSTVVELVRVWNSSPDYSHGYLVAPLAAWFLWRRRGTFPWTALAPSWAGLSLIALAALCRLAAARFYLPELDGCSIPLWLAGACWLFGGWGLLRWAAPALAFLLFLVPLPASIETLLSQPLQAIATTMSTWTLTSSASPQSPRERPSCSATTSSKSNGPAAACGCSMEFCAGGGLHNRESRTLVGGFGAHGGRCARGDSGQRAADHADRFALRICLGGGGQAFLARSGRPAHDRARRRPVWCRALGRPEDLPAISPQPFPRFVADGRRAVGDGRRGSGRIVLA